MNNPATIIIVSIITSLIASIIFYFFNTYLVKRKQNKTLVEYIKREYQFTKILILLEYNGNIPWHTCYEIEYTHNGAKDYIKDVDDYKELQTYILETKNLSIDYHNEYINLLMRDLLRFLESIIGNEFIIFNSEVYYDLLAILRFIRRNNTDTYMIINQFIFGYPDLCTTGQVHNAILNYSGCKYDGFIDKLESAYQKSLFKPFEKIIAFSSKLIIQK